MSNQTDHTESQGRDDREVAFFGSYYREQAYNLTGWRLRMEREFRSLLHANGGRRLGKVLSVGCGDGLFELMVARHADRVIGVDITPKAIELARKNASEQKIENVDFRCMLVSELLGDERFDTVVCIGFLHHVPEAELNGFLKLIFACVAPRGFMYCREPNINGVLRKIGRVVLGSRYHKYHTPDERELDPKEIETMLRDVGFGDVRIFPIDLTLIPATYILAKGPGWPLFACALIDRVWCASPFARWASGFSAVARKDGAGGSRSA